MKVLSMKLENKTVQKKNMLYMFPKPIYFSAHMMITLPSRVNLETLCFMYSICRLLSSFPEIIY